MQTFDKTIQAVAIKEICKESGGNPEVLNAMAGEIQNIDKTIQAVAIEEICKAANRNPKVLILIGMETIDKEVQTDTTEDLEEKLAMCCIEEEDYDEEEEDYDEEEEEYDEKKKDCDKEEEELKEKEQQLESYSTIEDFNCNSVLTSINKSSENSSDDSNEEENCPKDINNTIKINQPPKKISDILLNFSEHLNSDHSDSDHSNSDHSNSLV